jgi:hypoxanthine phosphoribosyltransferase
LAVFQNNGSTNLETTSISKRILSKRNFASNILFTNEKGMNILRLIMKRLLSEKEVRKSVNALARKLCRDYAGQEVLFVGLLKGAFIFMADLARQMTIPVKMDFVRLASYGQGTRSSGKVKITKDLEISVKGKNVVVVEDIIDTGFTLQYLLRRLKARRPRSLKVVALLDKPGRREANFQADYVGFRIDDHFVVGYGLDCAEAYRNLKGIYILK